MNDAAAIHRRAGSLAVKQESWWNDLLMFFGGIVAAVAVLWGKLREVGSQEKIKRAETDTANAQVYIGLGKDMIVSLQAHVADLQDKQNAHTEQLLSLYKELHLYKSQCIELTERVERQTLNIEEQKLKLAEQAETIEDLRRDNASLRKDNTALQQINRELMARFKNEMQKDIGVAELLADVQVESSHLGEDP